MKQTTIAAPGYHVPVLLHESVEALQLRPGGIYVDVTFENVIRYRQSIDAIIPLTKELKIIGEYEQR